MGGKRLAKPARRTLLLLCSLFTVLLLTTGTSVTFARYALYQEGSPILTEASLFYFESDKLGKLGSEPIIPIENFDPTKGAITFSLYNYADSLRYTRKEPISYTITVTQANGQDLPVTFSITNKNGTLVSYTPSATMAADTPDKHIVTLSGLQNYFQDGSCVLMVRVSCRVPYAKDLLATFSLSTANQSLPKYTVSDNGGMAVAFTATNGGNLVVQIPQGLIPDAANPVLTSYDRETSTCQISAAPGTGYTLLLFRKNPSDSLRYALSDFTFS